MKRNLLTFLIGLVCAYLGYVFGIHRMAYERQSDLRRYTETIKWWDDYNSKVSSYYRNELTKEIEREKIRDTVIVGLNQIIEQQTQKPSSTP